MKIDILATEPVEFLLYGLDGNQTLENEVQNGWYQIHVPYSNKKIEIQDIKINGVSISHILYTGYTEDNTGKKIQTTAVWEHDHVFKIWIHTNIAL